MKYFYYLRHHGVKAVAFVIDDTVYYWEGGNDFPREDDKEDIFNYYYCIRQTGEFLSFNYLTLEEFKEILSESEIIF